MKQKNTDMTSGGILGKLILFTLPLLGSSLIQQLYNTADMFFVGNYAGETAAAAVGSGGLIFTCLIGLFSGLAVGVGIVVAHAWGAGKKQEALQTAQTAILAGFVGSLVLMLLGLLGAEKILTLLNTPKGILPEAVLYVRIYFLSMMPMVIYNMGSSILRSCGESKVPFVILTAAGLANIFADWLLVAHFDMGVAGAAIATSISQSISAAATMVYLAGKKTPIRVAVNQLRFHGDLLKRVLTYGFPAAVQSMMITLSNILVQYCINGFGETVAAAFAVYFKAEGMVYLPVMACGQAITVYVGQNFGAGQYKRIKKGTFEAVLLGCAVTMALAGTVLLMPETIMRIFVREPQVVACGAAIFATTFPWYWICTIMEVLGGAVRGMGYPQVSMIVVLIGLCGVRTVLLLIVNRLMLDFHSVAYVYPITWTVTATALIIAFIILIHKRQKEKSL